jgi:hypothetical protein
MIKQISQFILEKSKFKTIFIFTSAFIIMQTVMMTKPLGVAEISSISPGTKILDLQYNSSPQIAHETLNKLGVPGRQAYLRLLIADFLYIFAYTGFFIFVISALFHYFFPPIRPLLYFWILPLFSGIFDILENIFTLFQINGFPNDLLPLYNIGNAFTKLKMIACFPCEVIVALGAIAFLISKVIQKNNKQV